MKAALNCIALATLFSSSLCQSVTAQDMPPIVRVAEPTVQCGQEFIYSSDNTDVDVPCEYFEVTESLSSINFHFATSYSHVLTFISTDRVNGADIQEYDLVAVIMRDAETMELISEFYLDQAGSSGGCIWDQVDQSAICVTSISDATGSLELNALARY